jgi:serine/threonine protein kinase
MSKRTSSDPTHSSKRPSSADPTSLSASRRNSSGGSTGRSAVSKSATHATDLLFPITSPTLARGGTGSGERNRSTVAPMRHSARHKKQHIMGDETIDEPSGDLDMEIDMNEWKLIGYPGTYAEGVYEGQLRSNCEEVAVKVVSLRNPSIRESKWVQEELRKIEGEITENHVLKLCEKKVLNELLMTQTLSNKHISFFVNYYKQSTTYTSKVLDDPSHDIHKWWAKQPQQYREEDRPHRDDSVFFVMEKMSGADLFDYNVSHNFGCGFMLAFEATLHATDDLVIEALSNFPSFINESDSRKEKESMSWRDFMYVDNPPQFFHVQGRARFLVLKFNTQFKRTLPKYQKDFPCGGIFSEDMRLHLTHANLICNSHPLVQNGKPVFLQQRLPLYFDKTFIRTLLSQIMIALNHAHGTPVYHDDLKPDNVMFKTLVHAHSTHESKICAKVIDWGCGGFSKDSPTESSHEYKPQPAEPQGEKCDIFCVGNIMRWLFDAQSVRDWHNPAGFNGMFQPKLNQARWPCPWNASSAFIDIDSNLCVPWNPNNDPGFKQLIQRMTDPNPSTRFSGRDVLQHSWMRVVSRQESNPSVDQPNPHVKKLNDLLYDFAPSYLKKLGEAHDGGQTEETRFLDFMKGAGLVNLRRSLDVLVMIPILEQLPYARSFVSANLIALLSKLVAEYMYIDTYPQRHLPRTMVLLSQLASHQSNEFLKPIFAAKYMDREHLFDGEGRSLLELIAYGVFDCHDPDPNHKACSLYTLLMLIAMSSPDKDDLDPLSCAPPSCSSLLFTFSPCIAGTKRKI